MPKFKMEFELEGLKGLKVRLEGEREDLPELNQRLGGLAGFMNAAQVVDRGPAETAPAPSLPPVSAAEPSAASRRRARPPRRNSGPAIQPSHLPAFGNGALDWPHDPAMWGTAQQGWTTAKKAMWLLYVIGRQGQTTQLSTGRITATFNKHFKQAGLIRQNNLARDLGKLKSQPSAPVSEDTTKTPGEWFLTQAGEKEAALLVNEALGRDAVGQPV